MGFTPQQQTAIDAKGKVIVSASAGSGKTTVMIEKIVRLVLNKTPVSSILAVTYTRKAAASMKEKLRKKLIEKINDPATDAETGKFLREQLNEVPTADISTIHSFCAGLIRTHFFTLGVDGKFGVLSSDTAEESALKNKALDRMFERAYASKDEDFFKLLSVYFRKKTDNELRTVFNGLYEKARNRVGYRKFFETQADRYNRAAFDEICVRLHKLFLEKIGYYAERLAPVVSYFERAWEAEWAKYEQALVEAEARIKGKKKKVKEPTERAGLITARMLWELVEKVSKTEDLFALCAIKLEKFPKKETARKDDEEERRQNVELMDVLKRKISEAFDSDLLPDETEENAYAAYRRSGEVAAALAKFLLIYDDTYSQIKKEKGLLDFSDLEHYTLELLNRPEVAEEIRAKYEYVFVDEYQDVNPVQEEILNGLVGENVFLVGDVKQSIYGFRGSESKYFKQKYDKYKAAEDAQALDLSKNFRSAKNILRAVNLQFSRSMTEDNGSVDYKNGGHEMDGGDLYGEHAGRVRLHLIGKDVKVEETPTEFEGTDSPAPALTVGSGLDELQGEESSEEEDGAADVYSVKAKVAAKPKKRTGLGIVFKNIIERELGRQWFDFEGETPAFRPVKYSDIAILTRKNSSELKRAMEELSEAGIPVSTSAGVNVCEFPEVKTLIDILKYIDNGRQDVPLCSALVSVGGLSPDELAEIRLAYPDNGRSPQKDNATDDADKAKDGALRAEKKVSVSCFREACERYAAEKNDAIAARLRKFFAYFKKLRTLSTVRDAGSLLTKIVADAKLEEKFLLREGNDECLKRIRRFIGEANSPEPLCVHDFLDKLSDLDYEIEYNENGGENSVHLMTMHSSKGLEFPVVIINDLNESFGSDKDRRVYVHEKYGLAPQSFDPDKMLCTTTVLRLLCEKESALSSVADELNIYYVALTRAKYALHVTLKNPTLFMDAKYGKTQADFTDFKLWEEYWAEGAAPELPYESSPQALAQTADEEKKQAIVEAYGWKYPFGGYENMPVKRTATALLQDGVSFAEKYGADETDSTGYWLDSEDPLAEDAELTTERERHTECKREDFGDERLDGGTSAAAGIAYHAFLEQFDFSLLYGDEDLSRAVESELFRIKENRLIADESFALLRAEKCVEILKNPVFKTLQGCRLLREQQFLAGVSANEALALERAFGGEGAERTYDEQGDGETIVFQGAIDLLALCEDGTARIVDYKYSAGDAEYLRRHYALQLALYRLAVSKITKLPTEKIHCSIVNIYHGFEVDMDGAGTR